MRVDNAAENENNAVCQARNMSCHCQPLGMLGLLDRLRPAFILFIFLSWKHFNVAPLPLPSSPWVWRSMSHYWLPYIPLPPPPTSSHFVFPPCSLIDLLSPTCQKLSESNRFETTRNIQTQCFFFTESLWMLQWTNKQCYIRVFTRCDKPRRGFIRGTSGGKTIKGNENELMNEKIML